MDQIALRTKNLGKSYRIDLIQEAHHRSLREDLMKLLGRKQPKSLIQEEFWALNGLDLEIGAGESVGLIGPNGSGKSTLLKIFSRVTWPTVGEVEVFGRVGALLEVGTGFHADLTGRENIFLAGAILGMKRREVVRHFDEIIAFSGVEKFLDIPVKRYSSGMFLRLAFSVMAHLNSEILIVDEVIAVGDASFQQSCLEKMKEIVKEGRTVIFVSHELAKLRELSDRVIWLEEGKCVLDGHPDEVLAKYESSQLVEV
ncbi:MAG: Teichoic acids export ATP-binding protein TagH [Chlamydiae bacterium]|nr:Teichoic acids export ATP-binding protein TagH [Chlamydiota bacterium]